MPGIMPAMVRNSRDALERTYDVVVVGSGAAGGVAAKELAERGMSVALLEAGPFLEPHEFLPFEQIYQTQRFWNGGFEPDRILSMIFVRGRGVGGTTLVNQCLIDRCKPFVFEQWQTLTGKQDFNAEEMNRWYNKVEGEINLEFIDPGTFNGNNRKMVEGFDKCGYGWRALRRGQTHCRDCVHCLGGCPLGSKQGTNMTFVPKAIELGTEVISNCEVESVEFGTRTTGHTLNLTLDGQKRSWRVPRVVFAAGTFGTAQILLRSGLDKRLPALGRNLACHPQRIVFGEFEDDLNMFEGGFQAVASDDERFYDWGIKLEVIGSPPITAAIALGEFGEEAKQKLRRIRRYGALECAIRDDGGGRLRIDRKGKLLIDKPMTDDDSRKLDKGVEVMTDVITAAGAKHIDYVELGVGLHLMGTCAMGQSATDSVVDHDWQIHGTEGAYICDASAFRTSTGFNIMDTVMAHAAMASDSIATKEGSGNS